LLARLAEKTTIVGVVSAVATLVGWAASPAMVDSIATIAGLVASGVLIWAKDR
jgi:hypothetical protein